MGLFNASRAFENSAKLTVPIVKIPKNTRECFNIYRAYEDGIFEIENLKGTHFFDRCYIFSDINYINQDDEKKNDILEIVADWLSSMSVPFKITSANEYRDIHEYIDSIFMNNNKELYPEIHNGMAQWVEEKVQEADLKNTERFLYLTVSTRCVSLDDARTYFKDLDSSLHRLFLAFGSGIQALNCVQRLETLNKFFHPEADPIEREESPVTDPLLDVVPASMETFKEFIEIDNGRCISVLFCRRVKPLLDEGRVLRTLTNEPYVSLCTLDYSPVERQVLRDKIAALQMNNEKAIVQEAEQRMRSHQFSVGISYQKEKIKDELDGYQDQSEQNNETCFLFTVLLAITAENDDELARRIEKIKGLGKEVGLTLEVCNYKQLQALNTALPIGAKQVKYLRAMLLSSVVAFNPFYSQELQQYGGQFLGLNRTTNNLVFGNRKLLPSPHAIICGHTGSGKSYFIKSTEIAQTLLGTKEDIVIIDPQNEFMEICKDFGGQYFDLTPKSNTYLNPLDVPADVFLSEDYNVKSQFIADQTGWLCSFCETAMHNIIFTAEHKGVLGSIIRELYEKAFAQSVLKWQPTLADVRKKLKEELDKADNDDDRTIIRTMYNALKEYVEGAYDMFSRPSNIDISNRFVGFGFLNVSEDLWEMVMLTIMHFLSNRLEYNRKLRRATRLIIDEAQVVCEHKSSADMLLRAAVTYRKFGGMVTFAIQNLTRAVENPQLRDTFSNCGYKVFLDSGGVDARNLAKIQELSREEFKSLDESVTGYCVVVWNKKVLLLDTRMSKDNILYDRFSTNFHEKAGNGTVDPELRVNVKITGKEEIKEAIMKMAVPGVSVSREMLAGIFSDTPETIDTAIRELLEEDRLQSRVTAGEVQYRLK